MSLYNDDYTILSIISFIIYIIFVVLQIYELKLYYYENKIKIFYITLVIIAHLFVAIMAIASIVFIHKVSGMKTTLMKGTVYYTQAYIKRANELGIIKDYDMQNAKNELNPLKDFVVDDYFYNIND